MPARILIVDSVSTNRIVLNVKLMAARYTVDCAADLAGARAVLTQAPPDLILVSAGWNAKATAEFCREIKSLPDAADIPLIVIATRMDAVRRVAALKAGAEDVMTRPLNDQVFLARIRSLIRAHAAAAELRLRDDTHRALGMSEKGALFDVPGRVVVIASSEARAVRRAASLGQHSRNTCLGRALEDTLNDTRDIADRRADVLVVDGSTVSARRLEQTLPRLVSNLRSQPETRHVGQVIVLPEGMSDTAAILLDVGVNDVVEGPVSEEELALRVSAVLRQGKREERLRQTVRDGLRAAVTDSLTGLYNRRYAQPHLIRLAERTRVTGVDFAMMMLDLDHFKAINDVHGHAAGDRVLVEVARRLTENVRPQDLVARIGGEEFLVAMPDTNAPAAREAAERLRTAVSATPIDIGRGLPGLTVTLSVGVAMASTTCATRGGPGEEVLNGLLKSADDALYGAKSAGRNTVTMALSAA